MDFTSDPRSRGHIEGRKQFRSEEACDILKSPIPDAPLSHKSLGHYLSGPTDPIIIKRTLWASNINTPNIYRSIHYSHCEQYRKHHNSNSTFSTFNSSGTVQDQSKGDRTVVTSIEEGNISHKNSQATSIMQLIEVTMEHPTVIEHAEPINV